MSDLKPCPFCGGEAETWDGAGPWHAICKECGAIGSPCLSEAEAIAAWNSRAELESGTCAQCAKDMGAYADSLCDPLKERINELLRCLENDWHIRASWDGLRRIWCIELTEEGVKLRDAAHGTLTAEQVSKAVYAHSIHADCAKYGVMAKRVIGDDQHPYEVCDCYTQPQRLHGEGEAE